MPRKKNKIEAFNKLRAERCRLRVLFVLKMRLSGAEWYDIIAVVNKDGGADFPDGPGAKAWHIKERQVFKYIAAAEDLLLRHTYKDREKLIARHIAQRRAVFNNAAEAGDMRTALAVLDSEAKLLGLYPKDPGKMTDAELEAEIAAELAAQYPADPVVPPRQKSKTRPAARRKKPPAGGSGGQQPAPDPAPGILPGMGEGIPAALPDE